MAGAAAVDHTGGKVALDGPTCFQHGPVAFPGETQANVHLPQVGHPPVADRRSHPTRVQLSETVYWGYLQEHGDPVPAGVTAHQRRILRIPCVAGRQVCQPIEHLFSLATDILLV